METKENGKELLKQLEEAERVAATNLDDHHPNVRSAWEARIISAKEEVKQLDQLYKAFAMANALAIFVSGDPDRVREFSEIAEDEFETGTVDAAATYRTIAATIEPLLDTGGRQLMAQHAALMMDRLQEASEALDVETPQPQVRELPILPDLEASTGYVRDMVRGACGDALNGVRVSKDVVKLAREARYTGGTMPVVIANATAQEQIGLGGLFGRVGATIVLKDDSKVTKETVLQQFNQIKKKLKEKQQ